LRLNNGSNDTQNLGGGATAIGGSAFTFPSITTLGALAAGDAPVT
jgi:hypothetical protein